MFNFEKCKYCKKSAIGSLGVPTGCTDEKCEFEDKYDGQPSIQDNKIIVANNEPDETQIYAWLAEWQSRLHLYYWKIKLNLNCDLSDMGDAYQSTTYKESIKYGVISIVDYKQLSPFLKNEYNFEKTLIHELLHMFFALLDTPDNEYSLQQRMLHQMIDELADAFYNAKYCLNIGGKNV